MGFRTTGPADDYVGRLETTRENQRMHEEALRKFEMSKHTQAAEKEEQARLLEEQKQKREALKKKSRWWRFFIGL